MTIDIGRLEDRLLQMSAEGAPGREFCEAISELANTGRFEQLREILRCLVTDSAERRKGHESAERYVQDFCAFFGEDSARRIAAHILEPLPRRDNL